MKKLLLNIALVLQLVMFIGCAPKERYYYSYQELKEKVISVEIVNVTNTAYANVGLEVLYVLTTEELDDFFVEFCKIECANVSPPGVDKGYGVKLRYTDYSYSIIGFCAGEYYSPQKEFLNFEGGIADEDAFKMLLSQYIEIEEYIDNI